MVHLLYEFRVIGHKFATIIDMNGKLLHILLSTIYWMSGALVVYLNCKLEVPNSMLVEGNIFAMHVFCVEISEIVRII